MPNIIDPKKCIGCGSCEEACPASPNVYKMVIKDNKKRSSVNHPSSCIDCGACMTVCPENAIKRQE